MKKMFQRLFLSLLGAAMWLFYAPLAQATGVYEMPVVHQGDPTWVVDRGEVISRISEGKLNQQLSQLATKTGNEVRFVTLRRLDYGETIESFTESLFRTWFPTPEAQQNQVLLVLDVVTNNSAIRTGEGVKPLLADEVAASVSNETIQIPLRSGDRYNQAVLGAGDRLVAVLSGNPDPGPPIVQEAVQAESTFATPEETQKSNAITWVIVLLILATVIPMVTYFWLYQ